MTTAEREYALELLTQSRDRFLALISPLSEAQMLHKPAPDRWSPAEITEHLAMIEDARMASFQDILSKPVDPAAHSDMAGKDQELVHFVASRQSSIQAPDRFKPTGTEAPATYVDHFKSSRERTITYITETDANFRQYFNTHFVFGQLDLYQWVLLLGAHNDRHSVQLTEALATAR